ncbi:hypothetical protein C8F04DRAFT_1092271 [Mycena alexandri]|uniref:XPG-I domain-containing protein n=1 Tax=Mycena alexandri TaxID=1745969 RepID=A0AAD6X746_9AGAR|nr:hypothetical protein C8F04DRAFT_1092271 [Mycena alexandri]
MGVPGLWKELAPAAKVRSLTELAVVEGFEANPSGSRGFRIGIDASIWFFHAAYGKEGENPELRTMFFRCATLMHAPFLPLFVFDGPRRPNVKRNKKINRDLHKLTPGMKQIVESFGFEWRVAPGEAEAELAYLNRIGVLDGILSDDVDNFLFGATTVIRNPSNNLSGNRANPALNSEGRDDKNHTRVYRIEDITAHPEVSFTRGDMILIGLCSGGDYDTSGMTGCGPAIAKALVRYGFGRSLYEAGKNLPRDALPAFLHNWRNEIRHELCTDSKGYIGSKRRALAAAMPDAFPDIDILLSYINPLTSESAGRASDNLKLTWGKEPDLGKLAATCEFYFEWGYRDAIIKRFKTVIWHGVVLRILRRGVLDMEEKRRRREVVPSTPTKNGRPPPEGTPSKMIAKHFSSMTLNPVEDDDDDRLITKITRTREHAYTDGILEYRLEIRPRQLVLLAESGIKNIRRPLDEDVWAGLTESGNEGGAEKAEELTEEERQAREEKEVLVWMPASMVRMAEPRLVEEFEKLEETKRLKKAGKGAKHKPKTKVAASDEELSDAPKTKARTKTVRKPKAPVVEQEEKSGSDIPQAKAPKKAVRKAKAAILEVEESDPDAPPPKRRPTKAKAIPRTPPPLYSDASSDDDELPTFPLPTKVAKKAKPPPAPITDPFGASTSRPRVVRDLTKGKGKAVAGSSQSDLKNFFPLAKVMARGKTTAPPLSAPLPPALKPDAVADQPKRYTLSAPTPQRQVAGFTQPIPQRLEAEEESDDDMRPATPTKTRGTPIRKAAAPAYVEYSDVENERSPSKLVARPFPLSVEDRPPPRRRSSITSSDSDTRPSRLTKSPRRSIQHTSPRGKTSVPRAASPTPRTTRVINISSDSDDSPPKQRLGLKVRATPKAVLRPTNFPSEIIDLSDL